MPPPKPKLLAAMQTGWDESQCLPRLARASTQLTQPTDAGGWTVKDHVIHLAMWEGSMNAFCCRSSARDTWALTIPTWESGDIDAINAVIYRAIKT